MSYIIDRRLNGKHKSTVNRQRFLDRYRRHIREAVNDAVGRRSIQDMEQGERITIPQKDLSEPIFHHGSGGRRNVVHPGNKEFQQGDRIKKPSGGEGGGGGQKAGDSGEGDDEFAFQIDPREFLNFLFEDLELPNLVKRQLEGTRSFHLRHGGIVSHGIPTKVNIVRSMRQASMRRRALSAASRKRLRALKAEHEELLQQDQSPQRRERLAELEEQIARLQRRLERIPFLDEVDLRYNHHVKVPRPVSRAVMFCIMDVSGSMNQDMKDLAKRFFLLLYLFLQRNYEHTEVVFIRHHTSAKEVTEEEFFYSRETGGTIVSSALKLTLDIIKERYPVDEWNLYGAQASDGDNWNDDSPGCASLLENELLPRMQHFSYVEVMPRSHQALWDQYQGVMERNGDFFSMAQIDAPGDIYPVFRRLFKKRMEAA
ncbi:YeaH/YhbH family protein [Alloalcanivorax profundimaris]|uniref:YeaH/YhbH family protein n=1 Tax=Alloalcanivorax profundimaris TaxID=2735259 RepID=UPI001888359A|nr:YeaH/YhbH family protein [Alloalcanivorax profundimaris]MBF1802163.1 YeaH/YhbH family protein [Alloalcanivorax profundimaris]